ncbi:transcriptional activator [Enterospora canceri]|uniref:histone acetyltransferase n=1 Tax=Enterospora canceri TaxID=1081671 RepID=A0A1Y1SAB0_9MICR|nr:transcriptional activator [Enterospora canceri]
MELFKLQESSKVKKMTEKIDEFQSNRYSLELVSFRDNLTSLDRLVDIKILFQRMLPKMPKEYIMRQVMDPQQCNCTLVDEKNELIGAICFRPAYERNLIEIVFFAVDSFKHIKGYGGFLMNCFKELVKMQFSEYCKEPRNFLSNNITVSDINSLLENKAVAKKQNSNKKVKKSLELINLYFMTYADNSAIGFFRKQGFTADIQSTAWKGYIKDYDGGTPMECKIHGDMNYLRQNELLIKMYDKIKDKMGEINEYHEVRETNDPVLNSMEDNEPPQTKIGFLRNYIDFMIAELYANPSAWPFFDPVSSKDVPEYRSVIKQPMDMSTIKMKHANGEYAEFDQFEEDVLLMVTNCYKFNGPNTQYHKCAQHIEKSYRTLRNKYKSTINKYL